MSDVFRDVQKALRTTDRERAKVIAHAHLYSSHQALADLMREAPPMRWRHRKPLRGIRIVRKTPSQSGKAWKVELECGHVATVLWPAPLRIRKLSCPDGCVPLRARED